MGYVLTEEGEKYNKKGLPEERLLTYLKDGPLEMKKASSMLGEDFSIALQWCKKYNAIETSSGKIILALPIREAQNLINNLVSQENYLGDVSRNKSEAIPEDILKSFLTRKLAILDKENMLERAEKLAGKEVTDVTLELIKTGMWKKVKFKPYNVEAAGKRQIGKRHPYNRFLGDVRRKLVEMGFREMRGPTIETEFWNFDALFQPQNHPSRDWTQTYSLKNPKEGSLPDKGLVERVKSAHENGWRTGSTGWGYKWDPKKAAQLMPRAHGTAISARTLSNTNPPGRYFAISRCYRPDIIDATHGVEFNQTEGIVFDESLNLRSLLGILKEFATEFAGAKKIKFLPDYYPFTEPSVQMSAKHPQLGWVELGGAGIFREELTQPLGINVPVIAWGLGIDRLAMFKLGINDIRNLFSQDLSWLRKQVVV